MPEFPTFDQFPPALQAAAVRRKLQGGESVFRQGDEALAFYAVERGRIRMVSHTRTGRTVLLYRAVAGECFAETSLFAEQYNCEAIADVPAQVVSFPTAALVAALRFKPELAERFLHILSERIHSLKERVNLQNIAPARDRVLEYLFVAVPPGQMTVAFDRSFREIADELNLTQETLYRTLAELEREGVISRQKRSITLRRTA
ncbi:MAG: Crp/Fnr family transcriptional regulator [Aphanocapsa lilacina HA4352-LM1]|jgi:CRP-like cAMP-binding protein|nr:Crp/Fnr family transcriptional regulator [Aphanocapsa lilacina HA4352-LM1]